MFIVQRSCSILLLLFIIIIIIMIIIIIIIINIDPIFLIPRLVGSKACRVKL